MTSRDICEPVTGIKDAGMFKCKECGGTEFQLMLKPEYQGQVNLSVNEHNEVLVKTPQREFIADLGFMNRFAVCQHCGGIKQWEYHFPKQA